MKPHIAIIGLGAIGMMYASRLVEAYGHENICIIADHDRIERYKNEQFLINGAPCDFHLIAPEEASPADLLIFAVKNYSLEESITSASKACGEDTVVLSFLNGVTSEAVIEQVLHPRHLLYCTVQGMDATRIGRQMEYTQTGTITLGEKDNTMTPELEKAVRILKNAGIEAIVPEDIIHQMWSKWMLNCGVNQPCAAAGCGYRGVQEGGIIREEMIAAMEEARTAARLEGIPLTEEDRDRWFAVIDSLDPEKEPSMRQDTRAGRLTEVDCFSGLVRELGKKHGFATPVNDRLYEQLTALNSSISS